MTPLGRLARGRASRGALALAALSLSACSAATVLPASTSTPAPTRPPSSALPLFSVPPAASPSPSSAPVVAAPSLRPATTPFASVPDPVGAFQPASSPMLGGCSVFPPASPWNQSIAAAPVDPNSSAYIARIDSFRQKLHPDFGSDPSYGIPFSVVPASQARVPIAVDAYGDESDPGPYPVPLNAPVEAGSDGHVLVVNSGDCHLYEMYQARRQGAGWVCGSGAVFDLRSTALRPDTWTSADAAGLPILPGLVRYDEIASGVINHALRFTVDQTQNGFIHPATHQAGVSNAADPPMGLRLRLRASFDLSPYHGASLVILRALQTYGMFVADNGSSWFISGATDSRWNDTDLDQMKNVPGSAFEAVQTGPIQRG